MRLGRISRNIAWMLGCRVAQAVCALIINSLTARYFGPSNYGIISYAASLVAFVTPLAKLGISDIVVNEFIKAPDQEGEILGTSMVLTGISSVACIAGLVAFATLTSPDDHTTILVVFLYSLLLFSQSIEQIQYWFHAKYLSKFVSVTTLIVYFIITGYRLFLLAAGKSIFWFAATNAIDHILIALILLVVYRARQGQPLRFSQVILRQLWRNGRSYILPEMMGLVLQQSDRIMLRMFDGNSEVGLYAVALEISLMTSFIFSAIVTSFRPMILERRIQDTRAYEQSMLRLYGITIYLALLQCVFILLFGDLVVNLLYGEAYAESSIMLKLVVCYTLFSYIGAVRAVWVLAENKQRYLWIISLCGMLLNLALNAVMIPLWHGEGAAIATLLTQFFTNVLLVAIIKPFRINLWYIWKSLNVRNWLRTYVNQ